jgi:hypothetical protein
MRGAQTPIFRSVDDFEFSGWHGTDWVRLAPARLGWATMRFRIEIYGPEPSTSLHDACGQSAPLTSMSLPSHLPRPESCRRGAHFRRLGFGRLRHEVPKFQGAFLVRPTGNIFTVVALYRRPDGVFTIPAPEAASFPRARPFFKAADTCSANSPLNSPISEMSLLHETSARADLTNLTGKAGKSLGRIQGRTFGVHRGVGFGPADRLPDFARGRNFAERFFNEIKRCRPRNAYDKFVANFVALIQPASIGLRQRTNESTRYCRRIGVDSGGCQSCASS